MWGRLRGVVAGVAGRLLLSPGAGETASGGAPPRHPGAATRARTGPRSREARQRPAVRTGKRWKTVLLPPRTRKPRWRRSPAHGTGHHDHRRQGCQGRRTATTERAPAPVAAPGSANAREQERRAAASNIPDSVSYFVSPNGPTTGPRRAPAIAQASHNFMERRLPGGIPDFPFRRPRGRPMYDNAVFTPKPSPPYFFRSYRHCLRGAGSTAVAYFLPISSSEDARSTCGRNPFACLKSHN